MLTAVIGQALRFDVHPPNLGVGGLMAFQWPDRVFDLFGGQVIGKSRDSVTNMSAACRCAFR